MKIIYNLNDYLNAKYVKELLVKVINPFLTNVPLPIPAEGGGGRREAGGIEVEQWLKIG